MTFILVAFFHNSPPPAPVDADFVSLQLVNLLPSSRDAAGHGHCGPYHFPKLCYECRTWCPTATPTLFQRIPAPAHGGLICHQWTPRPGLVPVTDSGEQMEHRNEKKELGKETGSIPMLTSKGQTGWAMVTDSECPPPLSS